MNKKPEKLIEKTDGNGNTIFVDNPDYYNNEDGFKKIRFKPTNIAAKKKKRK